MIQGTKSCDNLPSRGYDGNFLHVDVRDRQARWARVGGKYVGIAELVREPQLVAQEEIATPSG